MARIEGLIPAQAFEVVRDRIGTILADELNNQVLFYEPLFDANIFLERTQAIDKTEMPAINISLARGTYDNKDHKSVDGTYTYNVDVYANSPTTEDAWGDTQAAFNLQRLVGVCRYILDNPIYKTLGFAPPFISRVTVNDLNIGAMDPKDSLNSAFARLTVTVRVAEDMDLLNTNLLAGYEANVKLSLTDKGYVFTKFN